MRVEFTKTAIQCLQDIWAFKRRYSKQDESSLFVRDLVLDNEAQLLKNSKTFPFSSELLDYGIKAQERVHNNYRTLFQMDDKGEIAVVLLILHNKQDMQTALFRHQLIKGFN